MKDLIALSMDEVFEVLKTTEKGLSADEAQRRLREYGPNSIEKKKQSSIYKKFFNQFSDWFSLLLIFAAILAFLGLMWELSIAIIIIVIINAVLSTVQELRAERAMQAIKNYIPEYAKVIREGKMNKIPVDELVPGDLILLEEGDRIPADARIIESYDLWMNNIPLTGESEPQPRTAHSTLTFEGSYLDAPNLVFMSTSVAKGRCKAVISATGMQSRFGDIAGLTLEIENTLSPLQKEIKRTAKIIFIIAITLGMGFFFISFFILHIPLYMSLLFFIGVMVSCMPEGLQITMSSVLAINVLKMTRQNVLVKQLSAVQTLGSISIIATDKTGTITKGEMTVKKIFVPYQIIDVTGVGYNIEGEFLLNQKPLIRGQIKSLERLMEIGVLCNSAHVEFTTGGKNELTVFGDTTDGAMLIAALKFRLNIKNLHNQKPLMFQIPFDSDRKKMSTFHKSKPSPVIYTKGAPFDIFDICNRILIDDSIQDFTHEVRDRIERQYQEFAQEGLRVIAFAYKNLNDKEVFEGEAMENKMIFTGLAAIKDPPRPEVKDAVKLTKQAGIRIIIISGDAGPTTKAIAEEVNITEPGKTEILRGENLEKMNDETIVDKIRNPNVIFARVNPREKLRIVTALRNSGEIVAVTGDGANDAPSLREANIGIAMGASGTDIAREASDMILLDDSFASIIKAVELGRTIYENVRKFIIYVLTHNWAELIPFILFIIFRIPLPLLVIQILAIDLFIDIIPSVALSREPPEPGIMQEPYTTLNKPLFSRGLLFRSIFVGSLIATGAMIGCFNAWISGGWQFGNQLDPSDPVYIKGITMTFAGIVFGQIGNLISCRSNKVSVFKIGFTRNQWIFLAILAQISVLCVLIYLPILQPIFGTTNLTFSDWLYLASLPIIIIVAEELRKAIYRKISRNSYNIRYDGVL